MEGAPCGDTLLRGIRAHADDGLEACSGKTVVDIAAHQLKRAKPQLRRDAAHAMMGGTTAMLSVVEAWGDELVETIAAEVSLREDALRQLVRSCADYSTREVSAFAEATVAAAAKERQEALHALTHTLNSKAAKEQRTMTQALNTKLESVTHQLEVQKQAFAQRAQDLEEQNKELEARLLVSEEKLVAAGRREEAAKVVGEERLKASAMGRDALQVRIRRLERELKAEKELRIRLQNRSAAAQALWGKASDKVSSGALWTRLANAAAEQEQPAVDDIGTDEAVQSDTISELVSRTEVLTAGTPQTGDAHGGAV